MSAPRTDLDKQRRRHIGPIIGIIAVVLIALAGFLWWFDDETSDPEMPGEVPGPVGEVPEPTAPAPAPPADAPVGGAPTAPAGTQ
ncbi:hypothetical protein [Paracoccus thiocyanatus]|uniref:Uncharacterized protein n=1 Tax=Paracoccus thiocyanatus TaxID=34006 RepID=A0A3D8P9R2_9RHOB|nr:hypothetical protein [Paracoccus thiocyanatus]RDW12816.1 hypothetical protein DIE28_11455 [Paracoccus thiocyanatus]